jgi:NADPH2:quinone reductase
MKSRAFRVEKTGGPEALVARDVELPEPRGHEVRVRHTAIGVNFIDTYHRSGLYPLPLPATLGMEAAGVVEAIGDEVHDLSVGQRVGYAVAGPGAYAEHRVLSADRLIPLPDAIDDVTAAAVMLKGMTAEYLVRRTFPAQPGHTALVHAAAGGVGLLLVQWLKHLGVRTIGTVGSEEKAQLAKAHGLDEAILYWSEKWVERVRALTDRRGVDVAYDSVGKDTVPGSLDCLRVRGLLVSFGNASGKPDPIDLLALGQKGCLYATRPSLHVYNHDGAEMRESAAALFDLVADQILRVERTTLPLSSVADAHRLLEARATTGSLVLLP